MPLAILIVKRILRIKVGDLAFMDFCISPGILMLAIIRIGCFMNGCCRGTAMWVKDKPFVYPVQLIECSLDFCLLGIIMMNRIKKRFRGCLIFLFMVLYGIMRFFLEYYRNTSKTDNLFIGRSDRYLSADTRTVLSNGQIFSIITFIAGLVVLILIYRKMKKEK